MSVSDFASVVARNEPRLDEVALALEAEFGTADVEGALVELDRLGAELGRAPGASPLEQVEALHRLLGERHGFTGNREECDHPDNSMLDRVLARRTGLPILLSVVYVEVARQVWPGGGGNGDGRPGQLRCRTHPLEMVRVAALGASGLVSPLLTMVPTVRSLPGSSCL